MTTYERFNVVVVKKSSSFVSFDVETSGDSAGRRFDDAIRMAARQIGDWLDRDSCCLRDKPAAVFIGNDSTEAMAFRLVADRHSKPVGVGYYLVPVRLEDR